MNREQLKDWADFYGRLILVSIWNGLLRFIFTFCGGAIANQAGFIDLHTLTVKGLGWTLAGTVVASVAGELYKHPLPTPPEPTP